VQGVESVVDVVHPEEIRRKDVDLGGRLGGLSLRQQILSLAVWPLLQNLLTVMVGFADRIIAGHVTAQSELGAVIDMMGVMMYMAWLMMIMQGAIATGAQALVARAFGARDYELAERATGQSLLLGVVTGSLAGIVLWLSAPTLASVFRLTPDATVYFLSYLEILVYSAPMSGVVYVLSACLRGAGDTWTPFHVMVVVNLLNASASYTFAVGLEMGVNGIALGTLVGWAAGLMMILWKVYPRKHHSKISGSLLVLHRKWLGWNQEISLRIIRVGVPQLIEILGMWGIHAYGLFMIARIGNENGGLIGSHGLAVQIESISFMPGFAIGTAAATLAGQYLGAGSQEMAQKAVRKCWRFALLLMSVMGVVIFFIADFLVGIMSPGGGAQAEMAVTLVKIIAIAQPFFATAMVMKMSMRGAGATGTVMFYSFLTMFIFRVGILSIMVKRYGADLKMIWYIFMLDIIVQAGVFLWVDYRGKWMNKDI